MYPDFQNIINLYNIDFSTDQISEILDIPKTVIRTCLHDNHVSIRSISDYDQRQYIVDDNFFNTIDTEEKAYILGFWMADGYVSQDHNSIQITLQYSDRHILQMMKQAFHTNYPITSNQEKNITTLRIVSKQLVRDLVELNVVQKKSLILLPPPHDSVPQEMYPHLVRGYFDGDGSIWYDKSVNQYRMDMLGTYAVLDDFRKRLNWVENKIRFTQNNITCRMGYGGNHRVYDNLSVLYQDAHIFLQRKYQKYVDLEKLIMSK